MEKENIKRLKIEDVEYILVGTAHVSKKSADEVKEIIEMEMPDSVCVELCQGRYESLKDKDKWKSMDIFKVIKEKKSTLLLMNLIMSSYQKRMAKQLGVQPGQEMIQAIESTEYIGANLELVDRDIKTTFSRIWNGMSFWGKVKLFFSIFMGIFNDEEISEEELDELKGGDMLQIALSELQTSFPELKKTLIDERDQYLAQKIKNSKGKKIVAVLGAGHLPGIEKEIYNENDLEKLVEIPKKSPVGKIIGWSIPFLLVAMIMLTFSMSKVSGMDQIVSWILWNGSFAALGALIAWAHPLSILVAFIIAPISSLSPLLAAGWFSGLVEAFFRKAQVKDFESLSEDIYSLKGFWKNKVTRILLVVALTNIGSSIGTIVGGADIVKTFFKIFM